MHVLDRTIIPGTFQQTRCCNGTWQRRLYIHMLGSLAFCCHWIVHPWCTHDLPVAQDWGFVQRLDLETDGPIITAKTWRAQRMLQATWVRKWFNMQPRSIQATASKTSTYCRRTRPTQQLIVDLFAFQNARCNSLVIYQ
jgi:hypothetical protein